MHSDNFECSDSDKKKALKLEINVRDEILSIFSSIEMCIEKLKTYLEEANKDETHIPFFFEK